MCVHLVNKDIESITYNHLNLPTRIIFKGGNPQGSSPKYLTYAYDAAGAKLDKKVIRTPDGQPTVTTVTQYANGYIYENNVLQYFGHAEGYVAHYNGNFKYIYQYKDHLGNVRVSYAKSDNGLELIEENNYYAFGLKHKGYGAAYNLASGNAIAQNISYNGKEFQEELGLNWYDYGARNYDASIGRLMNIDPLAKISRRWSPYHYYNNNPVFFVDPDGMRVMGSSRGITVTGGGAAKLYFALVGSLNGISGAFSTEDSAGKAYFKLGGDDVITENVFALDDEDKSNAGGGDATGKKLSGVKYDGKNSGDITNKNDFTGFTLDRRQATELSHIDTYNLFENVFKKDKVCLTVLMEWIDKTGYTLAEDVKTLKEELSRANPLRLSASAMTEYAKWKTSKVSGQNEAIFKA